MSEHETSPALTAFDQCPNKSLRIVQYGSSDFESGTIISGVAVSDGVDVLCPMYPFGYGTEGTLPQLERKKDFDSPNGREHLAKRLGCEICSYTTTPMTKVCIETREDKKITRELRFEPTPADVLPAVD